MVILRTLAVGTALVAAGPAAAHVSLQPATATGGAYQVLRFGVGHGCDGAATTALRIEIPDGVAAARPQPKPGWTLAIERPDAKAEAVSAIVWRGRLPADQFDEFVMLVKLPAIPGPLAFPALQSCGTTVLRWTEAAAWLGTRTEHPAPSLTLVPVTPSADAGRDHHH